MGYPCKTKPFGSTMECDFMKVVGLGTIGFRMSLSRYYFDELKWTRNQNLNILWSAWMKKRTNKWIWRSFVFMFWRRKGQYEWDSEMLTSLASLT